MPKKGTSKTTIILDGWMAEERKEGVFKVKEMDSPRQFTMTQTADRSWRTSCVLDGKQRRFRINRGTPNEAISKSIEMFFVSKSMEEDPRTIRVSEMLNRWLLAEERDPSTLNDYLNYIKLFLDWLRREFPNVHFWVQLRLEHLQLYSKFLGSVERTKIKGDNNRNLRILGSLNTYRLYTFPINDCSEWAARNFGEVCRDFASGYQWSKVKIERKLGEQELTEKPKFFIPFPSLLDWIDYLIAREVPADIVAAITLQAILGMREKEVLRLFWEPHIFLEEMMLRYTAKAKNKYGLRYLPYGGFVLDVLSRVPDKTGKLVKGYWDVDYRKYSSEVKGWLHEWDKSYDKLPCSDLRNTLITTAYHNGWGGVIFERFVGHKGNVDEYRRVDPTSNISLDHYVGREVGFLSEVDFLFAKFKEIVLPKIEANLIRPGSPVQNSTEIAQKGKITDVVQLRSVS